jgi:hypothetical protein
MPIGAPTCPRWKCIAIRYNKVLPNLFVNAWQAMPLIVPRETIDPALLIR